MPTSAQFPWMLQTELLKSSRRGCRLPHLTGYSFSVGSYSGCFLQSPPRSQMFWNSGISCLEQCDSADGPFLKSFLLVFPKTTNPQVRRASLSSHPFTLVTGQLPGVLWTWG